MPEVVPAEKTAEPADIETPVENPDLDSEVWLAAVFEAALSAQKNYFSVHRLHHRAFLPDHPQPHQTD